MTEKAVTDLFYVADQNWIMATLPSADACFEYFGPVVLRIDRHEIDARQVARGSVKSKPVVRLIAARLGEEEIRLLAAHESATIVYPL